ncbi:putative phospholipid-translocating P-type ATPase (flippase) [Leishmania mexicana MHOM/GT/2001/U1103]|uniref:Phospholipid-transporting ATPase n=1 Tax=Leishmania mexicana (strain MHOM/GT/2001/U1103) TaxID=929439 RepID=E9B0Z9_LEIMU|nr:putative phospholipid-translocating P-type ATPase (flippase) [Leishmania mexicana MHOM/GT/2001/U1103]CBZ28904.1 putative phospholipid-translocating P-type ATPase (flippase) [Leishmania mexicana MHOM/GT/2001/U1103]
MRRIRPLDEAVANQYCTNLVVNSRYTAQNFIFKNLYEQFSRPLNLYFLVVALLQFVSVIAPVNPLSTLLPLLFAFTLTAVKEGYDDVKRHQQDHKYNHTLRRVLDAENVAWVSRINADIRVGDVLLLREDEEIPCDVVVLGATSAVYIRTDNLDGEIDLKPKETLQFTTVDPGSLSRRTSAVCEVSSQTEPPPAVNVISALTSVSLECPPASAIMDSFEGCADLQLSPQATVSCAGAPSGRVPLTHHHLLPQSCVLKNVAQAVCVAVYTGDDTKSGMNKREAPVKWAQIDKDVSRYSACIFVCQILNALVFGVMGFVKNGSVHDMAWYLPLPVSEASGSAVIYPLRFFLLTTVMIPVSFKFVVDVCKYYMARAVEWDVSMMHTAPATAGARRSGRSQQIGCKVKNSSILEDLGQIDYVLSDKTGTLTQNVMELDAVTVCPGHHISVSKIEATCTSMPEELKKQGTATLVTVRRFAQMVALCNTVEVVHPQASSGNDPSGAAIAYHAASPDEVALCAGMRKLGVSLVYRSEHRAVLRMGRGEDRSSTGAAAAVGACIHGDSSVSVAGADNDDEEELTWTVHHTFHFSSERRTMGVVVEESGSGRIWFIVKGADDRVMEMASAGPSSSAASAHPPKPPLHPECAAKLSLYAHRGFRTLLVACKELTRADLSVFLRNIAEASCLTEGRQAHLDALRAQMESGVTIIGITAIEDKLQDDVGETISDMLIAGIKVWMLTGDKMETAEQIGLSCGLYRASDMVIRISQTQPATDLGRDACKRGGAATNARSWSEELLTFPMERLPPPPSWQSRRSSAACEFVSASAAQMCGKALETRVLGFDVSDSSQLSNRPLRAMAQAGDSVAEATGSDAGGGAFVSGGPERIAVLVVEGGTVLETILQDPTLRARFREISSRCSSVICARSNPSQKAAIVRFVRGGGFMTLSVGDGGNDVAMLQEAHVGVGIAGKEGQQAARAADFSITQFSDLRPLLFVHGQQAYTRSAYVIKYSFYKSMLISFIQLVYNVIGTHVSGGTFWNSFSLTMWNGFYTLPQTIFYCFDRCASRVVLERNPYLYKMTRHAVDIRPGEFFGSFVVRGVLQSVGLLWLSTRLYGPDFAYADSGGTASNDVTFSVSYTALMLSQVYTMWWESHAVTPLNLLMLLGMPLFYVYSTSVYSDSPALQYFGVFRKSLDTAGILSAFGVSVALVVPSIIYFTVMVFQTPNPRDVLRQAEIRRQRLLLKRRDYKRMQPLWVRWFGATPEDSSMLCSRYYTAQNMDNDDGGDGMI